MKIILISQHYWPESFRINNVVSGLIQCGADVTVLTGQPNYPEGRVFGGYSWWRACSTLHPDGYPIHRLPLIPRGRGRAPSLVANYLSFIVSGFLIGPLLLRGKKADIIFVYGTSPILQAFVGIWFKLIKQAPMVLWVQDLWPHSLVATGFISSKRVLAAVSALVAFLYRCCDLILSQSKAFVTVIQELSGNTPIVYHPNPGDLSIGDPTRVDTPILNLDGRFNLVLAGNLGTAQALDTVVNAAEILRHRSDIHITLVGSGVRSDWLAAEIDKRSLPNLHLAGRFPAEAMASIYCQASALLVTLVRDEAVSRTIPSKIQSYLGAGAPIVGALDGEGARIVEEAGAGVICPAEDPEALAVAIIAMQSKSDEERRRMGEAGKRYYRTHFDPISLSTELMRQFEAVARDRSRSRPTRGKDDRC